MEYKINISNPKTGKSFKATVIEGEAKQLLGARIGDKIKGDKFGFSGYEFEITGGSDASGFPMRRDVRGAKRKRVLIASGVGTRHNRKGMRLRRTVVGNTVGEKTSQINMKVLKEGKKPLDAAPEAEATEEKPTEAPKKEVKEEKPKKEKTEEKKE
ncbi:MAG: 30S ribosomal protein S6e [archaeon]